MDSVEGKTNHIREDNQEANVITQIESDEGLN